jgi:hypothetical protein
LNDATEMLSQYSIRYPDLSLETSAVLDTLLTRTAELANTGAPAVSFFFGFQRMIRGPLLTGIVTVEPRHHHSEDRLLL